MAKVHWLALSSLPGVGAVTVHKLIERFGTIEAVFEASDSELLTISRVRPEAITKLRALSLDSLEQEIVDLEEEGIEVAGGAWRNSGRRRGETAAATRPHTERRVRSAWLRRLS